jgi:anti-sigma regulatory factor (Ser/Thr protein kinase)/serine/threonine protein phosphatase PrpC
MEVIEACEAFDLDDAAGVGVVRRRAGALAAAAGLDEVRTGDAALIATELASNVLKYARHGGAVLGSARDGARRGVVIVAWDRGPGMDVEACLRDGVSTAGTRGAGLGAVARIATTFDAYARPGRGSVLVATVLAGKPGPARFAVGGVCIPYPGLQVCGDAWQTHIAGDRATVLVCDGLGHGDGAAAAAGAVTAAFRAAPDAPFAEILERADRAARATRGAAATVARLDLARREIAVAGVGNVAAWIVGDAAKQLVIQHGTLGQATPSHFREERHAWPVGAVVVLCSDGLRSRWNLDDHPGLVHRNPATIATVMWRDLARGRDDATVVVLREATP